MTFERKELPGFVAAAILRRCRAEEVIVDLVDSGLPRDEARQYLADMLALYHEMAEVGAEPTEESLVAEWTRRQITAKQQRERQSINSDSKLVAESASGQVVTAELLDTVPQPEPEFSNDQYEIIRKLSRYMGVCGILSLVFGIAGIFTGMVRGGIDGFSTVIGSIVSIAMALMTLQAALPLREILEFRRDVNRRLFEGLDALCNYYLAQILLFCVAVFVIVLAVLIIAGSPKGLRHF